MSTSQIRLAGTLPTKRTATENWRRALLVEASHEEEIGRLVADLKAAREALHTARDNRRTAERDLQAVIDAEDPRIPGTEPAHRTIGVPEP